MYVDIVMITYLFVDLALSKYFAYIDQHVLHLVC